MRVAESATFVAALHRHATTIKLVRSVGRAILRAFRASMGVFLAYGTWRVQSTLESSRGKIVLKPSALAAHADLTWILRSEC